MSTSARATAGVRHALAALGEVIANKELARYLAVDPGRGELLHNEARELFLALPAVMPGVTCEEVLELGLWPRPPHNARRALEAPRYRKGRELFVKTSVTHAPPERYRPAGTFAEDMPAAFTHRAFLRAAAGEDFIVAVEGAPAPSRFTRASVFAWNEPLALPASGALSGVQLDYNDPLLKAHVCAAYLETADEAKLLDFNAEEEEVARRQARLIHKIAARVQMTFPGKAGGYAGPRAGALVMGGQGVCFVQRAVALGLLAPFTRTLAFDLQAAVGRTLRLAAPHGFGVITLRPSLRRYVVDPAWGEPLTDLRVAFFDAAYGHDRRLVGFEGKTSLDVHPDAVALPEAVLP